MPLNARQVETAKPKEKDYKLTDERGLFLLVTTNGRKYWRMKYRVSGKEKKLSIGVYPDISLAEARLKREEARKLLAEGHDPSEQKQREKQTKRFTVENTFHIRQYKKTCLALYSQEVLNQIADEFNDRPRKTLKFKTPKQIIEKSVVLTD